MKIALAQINPTVGDLEGNAKKVLEYITIAKDQGADLVVFPEMVITGYPTQDLLFDRKFIRLNKEAIAKIAEKTSGIIAIVGFVDYDDDWNLYNAAAIIMDDEISSIVYKTLLPTYDVFDEVRYFTPNSESCIKPVPLEINGEHVSVGIQICEDLWDHDYETKVSELLKSDGAELIITISASPFHVGKGLERQEIVKEKALQMNLPVFLINLIGGQDELVFDGQSIAYDGSGKLIAYAKAFEEDLVVVDLENGTAPEIETSSYDEDAETLKALALGIRDYFRKTGFEKAILGLSGGIDSAVTAAVAVEALGSDNVIGVSMPSKYSSSHSKTDAEELVDNLGIKFVNFPIQEMVDSFQRVLKDPLDEVRAHFGIDVETDDPVADENIQPRVRCNCLMDFSNRLKELKILVLNTGNKTELALGYCTLYGDMTGGVGVIGDVSKFEIYSLARYINRRAGRDIIPKGSIEKKPSAELKPEQFDPFDFDIVSPLVDEIVENRRSKDELVEMGYPKDIVEDIYTRIHRAEYKRWQAPPCIKITKKAFGIGWKMPIVNAYRG